MTVFISWSGDESKHVAHALKTWLPKVIQGLPTFMSEVDIPPGKRWFAEIGSRLEASNYGVICVTPENEESPWLNFEAGAIGKDTSGSNVTPFAISMSRSAITGPLSGFEALDSDETGFMSLVKSINLSLLSPAPQDDVLAAAEAFWPKLNQEIDARPRGKTPVPTFDPNDAIREIRETVRQMARDQPPVITEESLRMDALRRRARSASISNNFVPEPPYVGTELLAFEHYVEEFDKAGLKAALQPTLAIEARRTAAIEGILAWSARGNTLAKMALDLIPDLEAGGLSLAIHGRIAKMAMDHGEGSASDMS